MAEPILLLDVGNTRLKWALDEDGTFLAGSSFRHGGELVPESLASVIHHDDVRPARVVASCVASEGVCSALARWADQTLGLTLERITAATRGWGVVNGYARPQGLGSDRWAAMVAARNRCAGHVCIVDAGTAITVDLLDGAGQHQGGFILPGLHALLGGVAGNTAVRLSRLPDPVREPGRDTASGLANGALEAICAFIESIFHRFEQQSGEKVQCLLTGGDGAVLSPHLQIPHAMEPALVLLGLSRMAREDPQTS